MRLHETAWVTMGNNEKKQEDRKPAEKPISLHPLKFEEAVADLLKVKPSQKPLVSKKRQPARNRSPE